MKRTMICTIMMIIALGILPSILSGAPKKEPGATAAVTEKKQFSESSSPEKNSMDKETNSHTEYMTALFGAGCFWGVEASFRQVEGVKATAVGYAGGSVENPTYEQVCTDQTGHAEVVQVTYDPDKVSYDELLNVFWNAHDPTQLNRQGPDIGKQYRSVIFFANDTQRTAAEKSKNDLQASGKYNRDIVTSIEHAPTFWIAEDYHQQYLEKRGLSTCKIK